MNVVEYKRDDFLVQIYELISFIITKVRIIIRKNFETFNSIRKTLSYNVHYLDWKFYKGNNTDSIMSIFFSYLIFFF